MSANSSNQKWQGHTGGGNFGQRALVWLLRITPLRVVYSLLVPVVPFYIVFANKRYMAIYRYFRQQHGYSPIKSFFEANKNHFVFGQVVIDRFAIFAGKKDVFDVEIDNLEVFERLSQATKGFVMVSAHIGNYELVGYFLKSNHKKINTLVFADETQTVSSKRMELMSKNNINIIPVSDNMTHIFVASSALQNGQIVASVADRLHGSNKCTECRLLNGQAKFPIGTFTLATAFEADMIAVFNLKIAPTKYRIIIRKLSPDISGTQNKQQISKAYLRAYVAEIEAILRQYPEQWFNFYNFWEQ